jgi:hypothetical protein
MNAPGLGASAVVSIVGGLGQAVMPGKFVVLLDVTATSTAADTGRVQAAAATSAATPIRIAFRCLGMMVTLYLVIS